ncbi:MAG: hypothetical protein ACJ763_14015, partial [Bdellovibrionia bacterium]
MYNFGKLPPRAIQASGVASVLGEDCRVFYDNLFHSAGLGRVGDLLAARLRAFGLDELKLRAVLLFSYFEAFRSQNQDGGLDEPLTIECGFDEEKVAVGIAFSLRDTAVFAAEGIQDRVSKNQPSNAFEALLGMIYLNSDHMIVRHEAASARVEIVSLLAVPGKIESGEKQPMTLIEQSTEAPVEQIKAKEYVQLADLEYAELLKDEGQRATKKASFSTGEILSKRFSTSSKEESVKATVSGQVEEDSSEVKIAASNESSKDELIRVSGEKKDPVKNSLVRISGDASPKDSKGSGQGFSVQEMLKKVWPFKRKKQDGSDADEAQVGPEQHAQAPAASELPSTPQEAAKTEAEAAPAASEEEVDDPEEMAQILSNNFSSGSFSQLVERTQEMARQIKRESQDQAAKRWADGMSQQIMAEKVRLGALSQKINQAIRQKEQDLKKREQKFAEDLRRKEEALHQKTIALGRAKEQVAQLTTQLERQKGTKGPGGEENNFKQKYQLSQRMLTSLREENTKLAAKLEDLKVQTVSTAKAADSSAQIELANLKSKQDQMMRQNMQLKSLNEQLM